MTDFQPVNEQTKDGISDQPSNLGSPTTITNTLTASQAFGLCEEPQNINVDKLAQIQWEQIEYIQKTQEKKNWQALQQELLLKLHDQLGNKWTDIAVHFSERDHNCVKNHFYAQIRKSLRRLNYFIKKYFNLQLKLLNMNHVSKMITMLSEKKPGPSFDQFKQEQIQKLKRFLFQMSKKQQSQDLDEFTKEQIKRNVLKISQFLESVRKINIVGKKLKNKKQPSISQNINGDLQRTIKIQVKQQNKQHIQVQQIGQFSYQSYHNQYVVQDYNKIQNFMVVLVPWKPIENPINSFINPMFEYRWVQPGSHQFFCLNGNIFTNS